MTSDPVHLLEVEHWGSPKLPLSQNREGSSPLLKTRRLRKGTAIPVTGGREKYSPRVLRERTRCNVTRRVPNGLTVHMAGSLIGLPLGTFLKVGGMVREMELLPKHSLKL